MEDAEEGTRRPARFADVAVLIPSRSSLSALEDAFEAAGVPYRLEGAALLWGAEEVREVLAVLRAADDPADAVAVLGALRTPGLACGDDDLVTWHDAGGTWEPGAAPPPGLEAHPVALAMSVLDRLHRRRWWSEPSAMVAAAYGELRSFELALSHRRPRDHWHRLRWLQDQARLFDEAPGGTLRAFLAWADRRAEGDGRIGRRGPPGPRRRRRPGHDHPRGQGPRIPRGRPGRARARPGRRAPTPGRGVDRGQRPRGPGRALPARPDSSRPDCANSISTCSSSTGCSTSA